MKVLILEIFFYQKQNIANSETAGSLTESLSILGAELIMETIEQLPELDAKLKTIQKLTMPKRS